MLNIYKVLFLKDISDTCHLIIA